MIDHRFSFVVKKNFFNFNCGDLLHRFESISNRIACRIRLIITIFRSRVFHGVVWSRLKNFYFFHLKSSNGFNVETHFFPKVFHFLFCFCLLLWGIDFAPARGSPASVSDRVMTSQDCIKVEHVRTWLLSSSLAKFQQFRSDFFSKFCWVEFLLVTSSIFICCIKGPCLSWSCLVWARNVFFFVWNL